MTTHPQEKRTQLELTSSEGFFRLTTESIRQASNDTYGYLTIGAVVDTRLDHALEHGGHFEAEAILAHLDAVPSTGELLIHLSIEEASVAKLDQLQSILSHNVARKLTDVETISALLFDYILEQESARLATRLGFYGERGDHYRDLLQRSRKNVVQLR